MRLRANDMKAAWLAELADLNVCSQKGLVEMFDGSIGAGSVYMPYRWKISADRDTVHGGKTSGCDMENVIP